MDSQKEIVHDTTDLQKDSELPRKRAKFTGSEKLIRDIILEGIASKVLKKKSKINGRLPHGYLASFVNGCESHCPSFKINQATIRTFIDRKVKEEKAKAIKAKAKKALDSPTVDETAAHLLVAMKKNITPVPELNVLQVLKVNMDAPEESSQNTAVVDPSPLPPSKARKTCV